MLNIWETSDTVNTRIGPISINHEADTTAPGKITVHIPMLVHQRLKDKTGMAGMADGDNRHYGCQNKFAGKIHRYNGWHQCSILFIFLYADTTVYWNHSDFIQDCWLTDNTVLFLVLWSLTLHGALWMLELNVRPNSCISSMNSFVRFVVSHCLVSQSAQSSFVSFTFLCHSVQSYLYFV